MEDTKETDIELRSEDFQEILGEVPPWILRWGITTIAAVIVVLLIGSSIFKYPDTISSTMTLTGTTPTANVVAKASGKLKMLCVNDEDFVGTGQVLAVIDNPAKAEDVLDLKKYLTDIQHSLENIDTLPTRQLELGTIQDLYSSFYLTLTDYLKFKQLYYYPKKIEFTKDKLHRNEVYYDNQLKQKEIIEEQAELVKKQYERDSSLYKEGVLSAEELENSKTGYLQSRLSLENMYSNLENIQITLVQLRESLLDAENQYIDKKSTLETQMNNLVNQLFSAIQIWEQTYVLKAPVDGKITFTNYWAENQDIMASEDVFSIVPNAQGEIIGKALLPIARSGKVEKGQKVNIRFQNFPENEYGVVKGIVDNISRVPVNTVNPSLGINEPVYIVSIELPDGLTTTYRKELPFLPKMQAQADIITEDITLLERLFMPFKKIWKEGFEQ